MVEHEFIAIIPARGGSKRIPRKNIVPFNGEPMIAATIRAALASGCFTKVMVSTDDEEIAAVSRAAGAEVPFLRDANSDDHATVSDVIVHDLQRLAKSGTSVQRVAMLMANCPLRTAEDIRLAVAAFDKAGGGFQISGFAYGFSNPWWAHRVGEDGTPEPLFPDIIGKRSQDLPELLCPTGAIWLADVPALLASENFYGPGWRLWEIDRVSATDIDDYGDLAVAKALLGVRKEEAGATKESS